MSLFPRNHLRNFVRACLLAQVLLALAAPCLAEEMEPRRWSHLPIDANFFGAGYAYTKADISFDPVLKIEEGQADIHTWAAKYIRSFSLFDKSARIDLLQAYRGGALEGAA